MNNNNSVHAPDWSKVNWSKTNITIALELDVPALVVSFYRKAVGKPRFQCLFDWKSVDWSKNDQQLSQENRIPAAKFRLARQVLGLAPAGNPNLNGETKHAYRVITDEMIAAAPWEFIKDADLGRQWHITRERVRQVRQERGLPVCLINVTDSLSKEFMTWLYQNRSKIEGQGAWSVADEGPTKLSRNRKFQLMRRTSIPFLWRQSQKSDALILPVNWKLPNQVIEAAWNKCKNWGSNSRCKFNLEPAVIINHIQPGRFGRAPTKDLLAANPDLLNLCHQEVEKAVKLGVTPNWTGLRALGIEPTDAPIHAVALGGSGTAVG